MKKNNKITKKSDNKRLEDDSLMAGDSRHP